MEKHGGVKRIESILSQFPFYRSAPPHLQEEMTRLASITHLDEGDYFYHEGQLCPLFAMVGRGELRVFKAGETGRQITFYHVNPGETCMVNMLCAIMKQPAPASAQVVRSVETVVYPSRTLAAWVEKHAAIRDYVLGTLAQRLNDFMTLVGEISFQKMDQRLATYLLERFCLQEGACELRVTHEEIASELGSAREVISRLLQEFERLGAVHLARRHISLSDERVLANIQNPHANPPPA